MKFLLSILLLLGLFNTLLLAQEGEIARIERSLNAAKEDSFKVLDLYQLTWFYLSSDPPKAQKYAQQGIQIAAKISYPRGRMLLLNRLGDYYTHQGNYAKGIEYTTQSLQVAEKIKDSIGIADAYIMLGIIHGNNLKQYETALTYHYKALQIYQAHKYISGVASTYNMIAHINAITQKDTKLALQYTTLSIQLAQKYNNEDFLGWCISTKGIVFKETGKLDSALLYLKKAIVHYQNANDQNNVIINELLIGNIYIKQKNISKAISLFNGQIAQARKLNTKGLLRDAYQGLADSYALQQKYDSAYIYHTLYETLKDSLLNQETSKQISSIQADYEQEKRESKIALLEKEKQLAEEEKFTYTIFFTVFISALLMIIFLIARNNREKVKANKVLKEKNEEIETQNEELIQSREEVALQRDIVAKKNQQLQKSNATKDKLFSIISHDLRSPVGSLRNLFDLIAQNQVTVEDFMFIFFPKLRHSVSSLYDTLDNLLQWSYSQMEGIKSNPEIININNMIMDTISLFKEIATTKQITITPQASAELIAYADLNQVRLVLRNLLNNALKFTLERGLIDITATKKGDFIEISIKDTGLGMTENQLKYLFDPDTRLSTRGTSGERGTGLGLVLCKEMVENNGGHISVESVENHGSIFTITLPSH